MNKNLQKILDKYKDFSEVKAIAIGGSSAANTSDNTSDIDIYVFVSSDISIDKRLELTKQYSSNFEVGGEYFGAGDEYYADNIKQQLDVMYWNINWFDGVITNAWEKYYPSNGYTTCFLYTLKNFQIIHDTDNWLKNLQDKIKTSYPKELKENIIKRNIMLMKDKPFASYYEQIVKAIKRNDIVSINHRISAFLASYFDIIFATNELLHPGEKRLIRYAKNNCKILPAKFEENIKQLLTQPNENTIEILENIIENLRKII
ncbi:MAG: DUF4037 domain-containing protein [Candidatus Gastranaerophilales bacterium]|nr:DUF4037 domain-containing protein [Candidatus Gastranaerophilales bacterium]